MCRQVPTAVFQSLVVTLDLSRLDYCKVCWLGYLSTWSVVFSRVKTLQHSWVLAFAVLNTTDALASLHWLHVPENIFFKVAVLTYRTVNGSAPVYLSSYFTRVADVLSRLRLWSSTSDQLIVPSYNLANVGRRAFPVSAAFLWKSYTAHLTSAPSLAVFRQCLKTFLFRRSYADLIIWHSELTFCCGPSSISLLFRPH